MTIKARLFLILTCLSLSLVIIATAGAWSLYRTRLAITAIYENRVVALRDLKTISDIYGTTIVSTAGQLRVGVLDTDEGFTRLHFSHLQALRLWQVYRHLPHDADEASIIATTESTIARIDTTLSVMDAAMRANNISWLSNAIVIDLDPAIDQLTTSLNQLVDIQLDRAKDEFSRTETIMFWGQGTIAIASFAGLLWILGGAIFTVYRLARPLSVAAAAVRRLAKGDVEAEIPTSRQSDEIGDIVDALGVFQASMREALRLKAEQEQLSGAFRAQLEAIFRHAPFGVFIKDLGGRLHMVSEASSQIWGYRREDMIGQRDGMFLPPDEAAPFLFLNRQVAETGSTQSIEVELNLAGQRRWLWRVQFPVRDAAGHIVSLAGFDVDVTDRRRQEEELRRSAAQVTHAKRLAKLIFWWNRFDPHTGQLGARRELDGDFRHLTGQSGRDVNEQTYLQTFVHADDRAKVQPVYDAFQKREISAYQVDYRLLRKDGGSVPVRVWVDSFADAASGETIVVGAMQDITDQVEREAQLLAAKARAEMSDKAKSEFLANMSHELRTPLNAVIGYSDLLKMSLDSTAAPKLTDYATAVNDSGQHLLEIINDILDMARLEANGRALDESVFAVDTIIAECLDYLAPQAAQRGIAVSQDMQLPKPTEMLAEKRAFKQALINVLGNAIKFSQRDGHVVVTTAIQPDCSLMITIQDSGSGIDPTVMPLITTPFVQAGSSLTRRHGGTGLGLAITKKLLDLHGGDLSIDSIVGQGTRVSLTYPAERLQGPGYGDQALSMRICR